MAAELSVLDWVFLAVLVLSMALGVWRGFVYEVLSLLNWLAAWFLAQWFAPQAAAWLPLDGLSPALRHVAGLVAVFVAAIFIGGLLAHLVSKLVSAVGLDPADRALGALFGLLRGGLLLLVAVSVVSLTPWKQSPTWRSAHGVRWMESALALLQPVLPHAYGKYLPS